MIERVKLDLILACRLWNCKQTSNGRSGLKGNAALQADGGKTQSAGRPTLQCTARPSSVNAAHE